MPQISETLLGEGAFPSRVTESVPNDPVRGAHEQGINPERDAQRLSKNGRGSSLMGMLESIVLGRRRPCGAQSIGVRRWRGSNRGHPRDRREYSPLYYNDILM